MAGCDVDGASEPCVRCLPLFFSSGSGSLDIGLRHEPGRDTGDRDGWDAFFHMLNELGRGRKANIRQRIS